jgi:hypothetical protein
MRKLYAPRRHGASSSPGERLRVTQPLAGVTVLSIEALNDFSDEPSLSMKQP